MQHPARNPSRPPGSREGEEGIALILVVIFSVLLFVLVGDLITTSRMASSTGRNDALMARMENHLFLTLVEVTQQLKDDLAGGAEGEGAMPAGAAGGLGGGAANPLGGEGAGGAGGEAEEEPPSDSSQDAWFQPTSYADGDLNTYVFVEDENRKFNILSLASADEEFARESKGQLERLITGLREGTAFEISRSDASTIATQIEEWLKGQNRHEDHRPRPKLKSDDRENRDNKTIPLHLDELLLLRGVTESMFYDLVLEGPPVQVLPGLESVLTIYTSYRPDPGDPDKIAASNRNNPTANPAPAASDPNDPNSAPAPEGQGVKINVNTACRAVLRCLMSENEIPNAVIEGILRYRNEEAEEEEAPAGEGSEEATEYQGDIDEGLEPPKKFFKTLEDLDEVPELANIADPKVKDRFLSMLTTESDVFTVHMTCLFKRNEERKMFVMTRRRCVFVRLEGDEEPRLFPIIRMERRRGTRVFTVDFPVEAAERRQSAAYDMDEFSLEERKWNPYYVEFYDRNNNIYDQR